MAPQPFALTPKTPIAEARPRRIVRVHDEIKVLLWPGIPAAIEVAHIWTPDGHTVQEVDLDAIVEAGWHLTPRPVPIHGHWSVYLYPEAAPADDLTPRGIYDVVTEVASCP